MNERRCDHCNNYAQNLYKMYINVEGIDSFDRLNEFHWTYELCESCYRDWLDGYISTRKLIRCC